jgi:sterol 14-demethylase
MNMAHQCLCFSSEKLYEEQVKVFGNPDGTLRPLNYEDMKDLPVLGAVIRETLRMHPPIHSIIVSHKIYL